MLSKSRTAFNDIRANFPSPEEIQCRERSIAQMLVESWNRFTAKQIPPQRHGGTEKNETILAASPWLAAILSLKTVHLHEQLSSRTQRYKNAEHNIAQR